MIANFVVFTCKPGQRAAFLKASLATSRGSIEGSGCVATSIFADPDRSDVPYVFEVFTNEASPTTTTSPITSSGWPKPPVCSPRLTSCCSPPRSQSRSAP